MTNTTLLRYPADNQTPLVASDLEGTLTTGQTWRGMRDYLLNNGYANEYNQFFRRRIPKLLLFRLGLLAERKFKERWLLDLLKLCTGFDMAQFEQMAQWVVTKELWPNHRPAVLAELQAHQKNGRRVIIISGLFDPILAQFARQAGAFEAIGTPVLFANGRFTGRIDGALNVGQSKVDQLTPFQQNGRIHTAYGDTIRDIPMLQIAEYPVAVDPDKGLRKTAVASHWRILD